MLKVMKINEFSRVSSFSTPVGCDEFFISIDTRPEASFPESLEDLARDYSAVQKRFGLSDDTAVFSRIFVDGIAPNLGVLSASSLFRRLDTAALSVIEQKPVNGGRVSLLSCHLRRAGRGLPRKRRALTPDGRQASVLVEGANYPMLFTVNFADDTSPDTAAQTTAVFSSLEETIAAHNMSLNANAIRTWVFVRDIDRNYTDMVKARKEFFSTTGLTDKTRYLASTGIQGATAHARQMVSVDSLSIGCLKQGQVVRMEAPDHLSPTIQYGVTFERGLRVRFGDRSHLYISGTASIDHKGEVLFTGDAARQTERTIENIRALLSMHNAAITDMAYIIAYVRNGRDRNAVRAVLDTEIGAAIPIVFAEAAVCRPTWLVELEGVAVIPDRTEYPPFM